MRREFRRILESTPLWDKKVCVLQVTDATPQAMQIRALGSAANSSDSSDLQAYVREKLIQFMQDRHPDALPTRRVEYRPAHFDEPPPGSQPPPAMASRTGPNGSPRG